MYLLDTNVVSELRKAGSGRADAAVIRWAGSVEAVLLHLSVVSVQELEIGVQLAERKDGEQGRLLRLWLEGQVLPAFQERLLPVDLPVALRSAGLHVPNPRPYRDGLIAATALVHGLTLVTRNVEDFEGCGLSVFNPWL
jgi:predicted nucleic acid-binding protein